jgi:NitT/TauT family transport system ATP-binding protein
VARQLGLGADQIMPLAEALHMLEFAELETSAIRLTAAGRVFGSAPPAERRKLFREHLLRFVPLAAHVVQVLEGREGHRAPRDRFETELEDHLDRHEAQRTLRTLIGWGRYAELFVYDDRRRQFLRDESRAAELPKLSG